MEIPVSRDIAVMSGTEGGIPAALAGAENVPGERQYVADPGQVKIRPTVRESRTASSSRRYASTGSLPIPFIILRSFRTSFVRPRDISSIPWVGIGNESAQKRPVQLV